MKCASFFFIIRKRLLRCREMDWERGGWFEISCWRGFFFFFAENENILLTKICGCLAASCPWYQMTFTCTARVVNGFYMSFVLFVFFCFVVLVVARGCLVPKRKWHWGFVLNVRTTSLCQVTNSHTHTNTHTKMKHHFSGWGYLGEKPFDCGLLFGRKCYW